MIGTIKQAEERTKINRITVDSTSYSTVGAPDTLVTIYLQMMDWSEFRPAYLNYLDGIKVMRLETPDVSFYHFLYNAVGKPWHWQERTNQEIEELLRAPGTSVHVLYVDGAPAGYIELARRTEGRSARFYSTEIVYFGLRPDYMGRGLGKHLLSHGIAYAWNKGAQRLWVHTSNLDGPYALQNYIKRGLKVYRVDKEPMPKHLL